MAPVIATSTVSGGYSFALDFFNPISVMKSSEDVIILSFNLPERSHGIVPFSQNSLFAVLGVPPENDFGLEFH